MFKKAVYNYSKRNYYNDVVVAMPLKDLQIASLLVILTQFAF